MVKRKDLVCHTHNLDLLVSFPCVFLIVFHHFRQWYCYRGVKSILNIFVTLNDDHVSVIVLIIVDAIFIISIVYYSECSDFLQKKYTSFFSITNTRSFIVANINI